MMMCSRCKKRPAVLFISTMGTQGRKDEGLCLQCASELNLPQMKEFMEKWGINEDEVKEAIDQAFDENGTLKPDALSGLFDAKDENEEDLPEPPEADDSGEDDLFERGGAGIF